MDVFLVPLHGPHCTLVPASRLRRRPRLAARAARVTKESAYRKPKVIHHNQPTVNRTDWWSTIHGECDASWKVIFWQIYKLNGDFVVPPWESHPHNDPHPMWWNTALQSSLFNRFTGKDHLYCISSYCVRVRRPAWGTNNLKLAPVRAAGHPPPVNETLRPADQGPAPGSRGRGPGSSRGDNNSIALQQRGKRWKGEEGSDVSVRAGKTIW